MKRLTQLLAVILVSISPSPKSAMAQVYRFKPSFSNRLLYRYEDKKESLTWMDDKLLPFRRGSFVFDVDNKTITTPVEMLQGDETIPVTKVEKDDVNKRLIFHLIPYRSKDLYQQWAIFIVQFAEDGTTIQSVSEADSKKDYGSRDTSFTMYANGPEAFPFVITKELGIEDTTMSTNTEYKKKAVLTGVRKLQDNKLVMRPGFIRWTVGSGKKAHVRNFIIQKSERIEVKPASGGTASGVIHYCVDPADDANANITYEVHYTYTSDYSDRLPRLPAHHLIIYKYALGKLGAMYMF